MANSTTRLELLATSPAISGSRAVATKAAPDWTPDPAYSVSDAGEVLSELERILASDAFDASARNRAFLRHVVDETLAGRADRIKGYTVAQEVFHRDADFDPQLDPVVRIEASRLRRSLERYYLTAGKRDALRIELPKGGYVPTFTLRRLDDGDADAPIFRATARAPVVVVRPFANLSRVADDKAVAVGLADEVIGRLAACDGLAVVAEDAARSGGPAGSGRFILQGSTRRSGTRLRVTAHLLDHADARYLWTRNFDRTLRAGVVWPLQEEIAGAIAQAIGGPNGVLRALAARSHPRN